MKKGIILMPYVSGKGGTETVVRNFFLAMKDNALFNFKLVSIGGTSNFNWLKGVPFDMIKISNSYMINETKIVRDIFYATVLPVYLFNYIKRNKPDFIISTNPLMWFLSKKIVGFLGLNTPIIAWYHYSLRQHPIKMKYLTAADYYFAISSGIKRQLVSLGIDEKKIYLIFNPVASDYHLIRNSSTPTKFIFVGRLMLDGQKNCRELFQALSLVNGNWQLDIYGGAFKKKSNGVEIKKYIKEKKISNKIRFHGFVKDPWRSINSATALILTSKFEGLPMVLCEAISHGVFCISSNAETGPDDIINSNNGIIYNLGDTDELSGILQKILDKEITIPNEKSVQKTSLKFSIDSYRKYITDSLVDILS